MGKIKTWVAIVDGKQAIFYKKEARCLKKQEPVLVPKPENFSKETKRALGRSFESVGCIRHIIEPRISERDLEKKHFTKDVSLYLEELYKKGDYTRLILVAPPEILGLLRKSMSDLVKGAIIKEIDKDYAHMIKFPKLLYELISAL